MPKTESTEDKSLDIVGVGKLAKAIPEKAWLEVVKTACDTFRACLAPVTQTTSGIGRLIEAKFDRFVDAEKVLAAEAMSRATEKAHAAQTATASEVEKKPRTSRRSGKASAKAQPKVGVIVQALEQSAVQTDEMLRELWSNLIAQEIVSSAVHPEFPGILSKLSREEAQLLASIAESHEDRKRHYWAFLRATKIIVGVGLDDLLPGDSQTFAHEHLEMLHLIRQRGGIWFLTSFGHAFTSAVTDPSFDSKSAG